jgi:hypothetical protein
MDLAGIAPPHWNDNAQGQTKIYQSQGRKIVCFIFHPLLGVTYSNPSRTKHRKHLVFGFKCDFLELLRAQFWVISTDAHLLWKASEEC